MKNTGEDEDVIQMAVQALNEAQQRAIRSQEPIVFAKNGSLWRRDEHGRITLIKKLKSSNEFSEKNKQTGS